MVEDSNTKKSSSEISTMVRHLYKDALLATISPAGFALYKLRYFLSIVRPRYRLLWKRSISYLNEGIQTAAQKIVSLPEQIRESEMVNYWKDFIRGIPEYS